MDFALDPQTHDLYFEDGRLATVDGPELFCQQLRIRLKRQLGEWMWNTEKGIPYREEVLVRNPDLGVVSAHFKSTILGTPKALRLEYFNISTVGKTMFIEFEVVTEYGVVTAKAESTNIGALFLLLTIRPLGPIL